MRETWRSGAAALLLAAVLCAGCGSAASGSRPAAADSPGSRIPAVATSGAAASPGTGSPGAGSLGASSPGTGSPGTGSPGTGSPGTGSPGTGSPGTGPTPARPLAGKIVGIDPGHNGGNFSDPAYIDRQIWNGREEENCDTTGTETASGYTEARFNFSVASDLRADLVADGARVVMTRHSDDGVGPCVTTRAEIINRAHADVAIDIHADGGPAWGRGFTVLEPVADGPNDKVIRASAQFGGDVRAALLKDTTMPESDYYGHDGLIVRDDLAGLNLTTVPKVLVECGNMPNATDAKLLTRPSFQRQLAGAFTAAIIKFLAGRQA
jgi:N-acetylmuramoyl-L-alanine amidase